MARAAKDDYFHNMRFRVDATVSGDYNPFAGSQAGFSAVTTPEMSLEAVEYAEGHHVFTMKFPGKPSVGGDLTMSRGVTFNDTVFYDWSFRAIVGTGEYRTNLSVKHYHRLALPETAAQSSAKALAVQINAAASYYREYIVQEAFPSRIKIAGDLDATASDISISELDVAYEHFYVNDVKPA